MALPEGVTPGTWNLDTAHSEISFTVRHGGLLKVRGTFKDFSATAQVGESVAESSVNIALKVASVDTRDANRDAHVQAPEFFNSAEFPEITFVTTSLEEQGQSILVQGDLSIKGTTKPIAFEAAFAGVVTDPMGHTRAILEGETEFKRSEFNVGEGIPSALVSDKVVVELNLGFLKPEA